MDSLHEAYVEVTVRCAPESEEAVSALLLRAGSSAVSSSGAAVIAVAGALPRNTELSGRLAGLARGLARLGDCGLPAPYGQTVVSPIEDEDWWLSWRRLHAPFRVGHRIVVKPSWADWSPGNGDLVIEMDPGQAFGTGLHPTTRLCLSALESVVRPGSSVADVGTGSGILAIAAALLGAASVVATDTDPVAMDTAVANVDRHGLAARVAIVDTAAFWREFAAHDVAAANLTGSLLCSLMPRLASCVAYRGTVVLGGIACDEVQPVAEQAVLAGLVPRSITTEDGWSCIVADRAVPA